MALHLTSVSGAFACQCNWSAWWARFSLWMCFKTSCRVLGGLRHCSSWAVHQRDRLSPSVWRLPATSKVLMWTHFVFEHCRSSLYLTLGAHSISAFSLPLCDLPSGSRLWQVYPSLWQHTQRKEGSVGRCTAFGKKFSDSDDLCIHPYRCPSILSDVPSIHPSIHIFVSFTIY